MSEHHNAPPNPYLERRRSPEQTAALEKRVQNIEALLLEKGLVSKDALDKLVEHLRERSRANERR